MQAKRSTYSCKYSPLLLSSTVRMGSAGRRQGRQIPVVHEFDSEPHPEYISPFVGDNDRRTAGVTCSMHSSLSSSYPSFCLSTRFEPLSYIRPISTPREGLGARGQPGILILTMRLSDNALISHCQWSDGGVFMQSSRGVILCATPT